MTFDFAGKCAVVTGASRGIGEAIARQLDVGGARVALVARSADRLEAIAADLDNDPVVVPADLSDPDSVAHISGAVIAAFGGLDVLVNNAAIERNQPATKVTGEAIDETLFVNLRQAFMLCSVFAKPLFVSRGAIVNVSSTAATGAGGTQGAYASTKGGVVQMTRVLATAWAKDNIQCNSILPGWIDTNLTQAARKQVDGLHERVEARTPAGRWGKPEDFAGIAVFLASKASDFVTGTAIPVDGGYSILGG